MSETNDLSVSSGSAVFAFDEDLRVVAWNEAAERLTGVPAADALGLRCWQVLGGRDDRGALVCHRGCSGARLVREGHAVSPRELVLPDGRRLSVDTLAVRGAPRPLFLHVLREAPAPPPCPPGPPPQLTARQREVLELLAQGLPAKTIGARLGLREPTVRNHIRGLLLELGAHSQIEGLARARGHGLL